MRVSQILIEAKKLIDTPDKWTKWANARDKDGNPLYVYTGSNAGNVACMCSNGAVMSVALPQYNSKIYLQAMQVLDRATHAAGFCMGIVSYNDAGSTTHTDLMAIWDKAIAAAQHAEAIA
jgi:hypothetical protein